MSEENGSVKRQILDDLFDAYMIVSGNNYVSLYDAVGKMTRYSPAAVDLFGLPGEYIEDGADDWSEYVHPEDRKRYQDIMGELLSSGRKFYNLTYRCRLKDGSYALFRFVGSVLYADNGMPELVGGTMINEGLLENTDPVTVLRNRYGFFADIAAMKEMKKDGVILMIGISGMDEINSAHGFGYGNRVLRQVGWQIEEVLGQEGTVYRLEGVRFAFLTDNLTPERVTQAYESIRQTMLGGIHVDDLRQNLNVSGAMITLGGAVNEQALYTCLGYAYNESKNTKNGKLVFFDGKGDKDSEGTLEMIAEIRDSILTDYKGFSLKFQPIVNSQNEEVTGLETLIRYRSDRFGDISPEQFVPILERDFVFEELGYWILRNAMQAGKKFLEINPKLRVGVNLAQVQLEDDKFIEQIEKLSDQTSFPLENLCLELTKGCRTLDMEYLKNVVKNLQDRGVRFVIDDFGTGVASIDFLRELSADYIKFDRRYINGISKNEEDRQIVNHLSDLAAACNTNVIIKGVENKAIYEAVKDFTIRNLQGYYYSRALSEGDVIDYIKG